MTEETLFIEALEIPDTAGRARFLDWACAGDAVLRGRLERLIGRHERAGDFLARPAAELDTKTLAAPNEAPTATAPAGRPADVVGTAIGPYKLVEVIGEGGMGTVYLAQQQEPVKRLVAVKVIKPGMDTALVVARFEAERQALALMDHPNIAKVFDAGATEAHGRTAVGLGRPYFVMELVRGTPMTRYCDEHKLSPKGRLELFVTVCQAVQHAHQKGIIHRDLKPSNVLVAPCDGKPVVKVIDFGVAKAAGQPLTEKTLVTGVGAVIGTLEYMSPEQAELNNLDVDTRSDVYSLGVLLYELLTGTTPLPKKRARSVALLEGLRLVREEDPPRPSTRLSSTAELPTIAAARGLEPKRLSGMIRGELDWIVMRALEKDRNRRYESAAALAADVQRYLHDEAVQACPPSAPYRLRKFARRNRGAVLAGAGAALALLVAVASAVLVQAANTSEIRAEQKQTKEALDRETATNAQLNDSLKREERARYLQSIALAAREVEARNVGRAEELLEECPAGLRGWEWHYLKRRCVEQPVTVGHPGWALSVAVSPDGKTVASTTLAVGLGEIRVWERATGKEIHRLLGHLGPCGVVFHPDGKTLISGGDDKTLRAWDLASGKEIHRVTVAGGIGNSTSMAVSRDGRLLVTGHADNGLRVRDAETFQELQTLRGHTGFVHASAFGPGARLVTGSFDGTVRVWDAAAGRELHTLRGHHGPVFGAAFSRDGERVASCGLDGTTRVWDPATGRLVQTLAGENVMTIGVAFSPDGKRLATGSLEKVVRVWDLEGDQEALTLRGHTDAVFGVAFSPDGDQIVSCGLDSTVRVWDGSPLSAAPRPGVRTLRGHTGAVLGVTFQPGTGPDARTVLASGSLDGTVRLWDPATGEAISTFRGRAMPKGYVTFSRDGRRVASTDFFGVIKVWEAATDKEIRTFHGTVSRAALSPDGKRIAYTGEIGTVQVRDVDTGAEVLAPFPAHTGPVMYMAFSPDGKKLATSGWDHAAAVWDATTGRRLHTLTGHRHNVVLVEFSDDGMHLVTASWDKTPKLWDAATGREVRTFVGHDDNVTGAALSRDGRFLASSSLDNTVRVWDASSGEVLAVLRGHTGYVLSVAFSPDGKYLASSSGYRGKGEVKVWDAMHWDRKPHGK